uniref:Uncharacterized protein n=1 Tax=Anopheles coluzzii TaxID=1518534 RepID=A0A8W7PFR3_ANOCL
MVLLVPGQGLRADYTTVPAAATARVVLDRRLVLVVATAPGHRWQPVGALAKPPQRVQVHYKSKLPYASLRTPATPTHSRVARYGGVSGHRSIFGSADTNNIESTNSPCMGGVVDTFLAPISPCRCGRRRRRRCCRPSRARLAQPVREAVPVGEQAAARLTRTSHTAGTTTTTVPAHLGLLCCVPHLVSDHFPARSDQIDMLLVPLLEPPSGSGSASSTSSSCWRVCSFSVTSVPSGLASCRMSVSSLSMTFRVLTDCCTSWGPVGCCSSVRAFSDSSSSRMSSTPLLIARSRSED